MEFKINPNIFRAYDIRGIYPEGGINEEIAYLVGRAFVRFLQREKRKKLKIVVGRDNRLSSEDLFKALIKGIINQGAEVINIGFATTPMFYFSVAHFKFDGGINITASHNPSRYNGFKLVREKAIPVTGESGLEEIKKIILTGISERKKRGRLINKKMLGEYLEFNLKNFNLKKIKPSFKIVIDTANAVPGIVVRELAKRLNCKIFHIYAKLDGNFPSHGLDPHLEENLKGLKRGVLAKKADLGIAFDGDGDRIVFVDERGRRIAGDLITALIAKLLLRENPGEKILCDVRSSNIVKETIAKEGGKVVLGRIGHSFIKEKMGEENILFQGELNGHYYLRSHYFSEAPIFVLLKILELMSKTGKTISELVQPFAKYFHSGEINFKIQDKNKVKTLKVLESKFREGKISKIDGLRVDFPNWWFNVRPSNTEPLLRLVVEARTKKLMREKVRELKLIIKNI